ncbi:MAG: 2Fe-2S iron-sulfur cluster-binding protein [Dokdonella sp.]|uniref:2Fe-2S iron-sulfur cluster-binding protein n=1 Tax=Dokdonella sp. TaxID=2291710 RepID=UPI003266D15E
MPTTPSTFPSAVSRRAFLGSVAATAGAAASGLVSETVGAHPAADDAGTGKGPPPTITLSLRINGEKHSLTVESRVTLLDALRDHVGLVGTKKGCDRGQCGACTVLVNDRRINACLTLAVMHEGDDIRTVEGLSNDASLSPLQQAFIRHDAFQCGFCTPGQLCSATALIGELQRGEPSHVSANVRAAGSIAVNSDEIRERMSGNLCRCGAYPNIVAAIAEVVAKERA